MIDELGTQVRTPDWRYTVWLKAPGSVANFGDILGQELYDHSMDPPASSLSFNVETYNLASIYPDVCTNMFQLVSQRYNGALVGRRRAATLTEATGKVLVSKRTRRNLDL